MKKFKIIVLAMLLVITVVFAAGCGKEEKAAKDFDKTVFKTGTWDGDGVKYIFYEDGANGYNFGTEDGLGIGFAYEINEDGSSMFHMGGAEDNTPATVKFTDENHATVTWEDGSQLNLKFINDKTTTD